MSLLKSNESTIHTGHWLFLNNFRQNASGIITEMLLKTPHLEVWHFWCTLEKNIIKRETGVECNKVVDSSSLFVESFKNGSRAISEGGLRCKWPRYRYFPSVWRIMNWRHGLPYRHSLVWSFWDIQVSQEKGNRDKHARFSEQGCYMIIFTVFFKGSCSDPQPHPPKFFQTYGDFGTRSWVSHI